MGRVRPSLIRRVRRAALALTLVTARTSLADPPPDAGSPAAPARPNAPRDAIMLRAYVDLGVRLRSGTITVERARPGRHNDPVRQPLFRGRYVARVVPRALLPAQVTAEAIAALDDLPAIPAGVPFDFPLLADADAGEEQRLDALIRDPARVRADATVRVPRPDAPGDIRDLVAIVVDTRTGAFVARPLPIAPVTPSR